MQNGLACGVSAASVEVVSRAGLVEQNETPWLERTAVFVCYLETRGAPCFLRSAMGIS